MAQFENKCVFWYTDNIATQQIIKYGSNKTHIHLLTLYIFNLTFDHNIHLEVFWVGREYIKEADKISKTIDIGDWYTTQHLINILEQRWGKISIDRFASDINRKSKRLNSRYLCLETERLLIRLVKRSKSLCGTNISHTRSYKTLSNIACKI